MKEFLNKIRVPDENTTMKSKIVNTILIFLLGIILGLFSKWLDIRFRKCFFIFWNMDFFSHYNFCI